LPFLFLLLTSLGGRVSGSVIWSYQPPSGDTFTIISSAHGNGLVEKIPDQNSVDTVVRIDSTGVAVDDTLTGSNLGYLAQQIWPGVPTTTGAFVAYSDSPIQFSISGLSAPTEFGTNKAAQNISVTNFSQYCSNQATITNEPTKYTSRPTALQFVQHVVVGHG
jgi:hypothetical protein